MAHHTTTPAAGTHSPEGSTVSSDRLWEHIQDSYNHQSGNSPSAIATSVSSSHPGHYARGGAPGPLGADGASYSTHTSWSTHTLPPLEADTLRVRDKQWLDLLGTALGPVRGTATVALATYLRSCGHSASWLAAGQLALDLLSVETDATCDTIRALLDDNWQGTVGELLVAGRTL